MCVISTILGPAGFLVDRRLAKSDPAPFDHSNKGIDCRLSTPAIRRPHASRAQGERPMAGSDEGNNQLVRPRFSESPSHWPSTGAKWDGEANGSVAEPERWFANVTLPTITQMNSVSGQISAHSSSSIVPDLEITSRRIQSGGFAGFASTTRGIKEQRPFVRLSTRKHDGGVLRPTTHFNMGLVASKETRFIDFTHGDE